MLDLGNLRTLVDQLEQETAEASAAKASLDTAQAAAAEAQTALSTAVDSYTKENDERLAKMAEIVSTIQTAISEG